MSAKLSAEQEAIVTCPPDRHAIVRAVAGSGKSTVLVHRLKYLHEVHRVPAQEILAVMFNRDAANQLYDRMVVEMGGKLNTPQSLTYHGLGTQMLNQLIHAKKAPRYQFEANPEKAVSRTMDWLKPYFRSYSIKRPRRVAETFLSFVDRIKGDLVDARTAFLRDEDMDASQEWFIAAYKTFEQERHRNRVRFFSDLIYDPLVIIQKDPEAAALVANRYQHIVVDEYQDICEAQQQLVNAVAGTRAKLMVVGDDDQTIYTWRGALPDYILYRFAEMYRNPIEFQLSRTWRYGHAISLTSNSVISKNVVRTAKMCVSGSAARRSFIQVVSAPPDNDAPLLVPRINAWLTQPKHKLNDIAVLFRTYGRSGAAQLELLNAGIPFRMAGPETAVIFQNRWVVYLMTWLQLAAGDFAREPFVGEPDYNSIATVVNLVNPAFMEGMDWPSCRALAKALLICPTARTTVSMTIPTLPNMTAPLADRLNDFARIWDFVRNLSKGPSRLAGSMPQDMAKVSMDSAVSLFRFVYTHFNMESVIARSSASKSAAEDNQLMVEALGRYIGRTGYGVEDALQHIQHLITFSESSMEAVDAMTITSVHRSKGLEWPCVILPDLRQGWFPHVRGLKAGDACYIEGDKLEDERRLFYVAMTRACNLLVLIIPEDRNLEVARNKGVSAPLTELKHAQDCSQFVYEMNLSLNTMLENMLHTGNINLSQITSFEDHKGAIEYLESLGLANS